MEIYKNKLNSKLRCHLLSTCPAALVGDIRRLSAHRPFTVSTVSRCAAGTFVCVCVYMQRTRVMLGVDIKRLMLSKRYKKVTLFRSMATQHNFNYNSADNV